ncbi:hypothetical protein HKBW3S42_01527, partial [Candidatus Hakubella thermalkaliphila]
MNFQPVEIKDQGFSKHQLKKVKAFSAEEYGQPYKEVKKRYWLLLVHSPVVLLGSGLA